MDTFWRYEGSGGLITERDSITNRVKGGVSQVHQRFLFLGDADGESGGFVFRDRLRGKRLSEVDVDDRGKDSIIRSDVHMKAERPETLTVA